MNGLFAAAVVLMAAAGTTSTSQVTPEEPKKEKKICRSEKATGSLTRVNRVCLTQAQWNELAARTRKGLDEMGRNASGGAGCATDATGGCR